MIARFNLDFSWDSTITLRAVKAVCVRSASVALGTLGPSNESNEENYPKTSADATTPSGPSVSLHALTAQISINSFLSLEVIDSKFSKCTSYWFIVSFFCFKCTVMLCLRSLPFDIMNLADFYKSISEL